ncbi:hypothetical protein J8184_004746 [Escherichia coli]|nr:hypothetical protein [Escherichia coli]
MSIKNDGHYFCRAGGNRPDGLNEPVTLEDKQAQDMDRRRQEAEREQLQNEIAQLRQALELEKKRGFWSRLFGR